LLILLAHPFGRPTRLENVVEKLHEFVNEFFDQNPLSHLALIGSRNGKAEKLADLSTGRTAIVRMSYRDSSVMRRLPAESHFMRVSVCSQGYSSMLII
jgi:hypothetical protein